ncbi:MAG: ATP-binding protein [Methylotenera sp.]|nr:ATP-binding protein [Methylotenera sp.]MDO9389361.1 ATP-binding protein [Methylotenera sp.]
MKSATHYRQKAPPITDKTRHPLRFEVGQSLQSNSATNLCTLGDECVGSEWITGELLDQLTHHVHILEINGDSYRLITSQHHQNQVTKII